MSGMSREPAPVGAVNEVAVNKERVFLQLQTAGAVRVFVTQGPASPDSLDGIVLDTGRAEELDLAGLEAGDRVSVTSLSGETEYLLVLTPDETLAEGG